ncbi:type II toxin-antitoxin system Phd/YefM family antitoxin [Microcella humidisoli]|jgi:prevent-host-death family protein|uniref:Antitoxin n=1 Tax=Microcella humidisoli TaxID=2963406 RepID=A0ABY5FXD7_9MICO|nr:type II toxin-antitoxin system prevent-host-death family antitoxin [Microcella humidisoli]UTT62597.1 type II toxin-antitoxin system prevent-host-death family antitoxin [Microcella humidisoli]
MEPVNILDARNSLSKLVAAAENGDDVVIAKRGRPVVRLVPVEPPRTTAGALAERLVRNPPPHSRSAAEIDADIRDARESWGS